MVFKQTLILRLFNVAVPTAEVKISLYSVERQRKKIINGECVRISKEWVTVFSRKYIHLFNKAFPAAWVIIKSRIHLQP